MFSTMMSYSLSFLPLIIAAAGFVSTVAGRCNSFCGRNSLPYPFGFSRGCPIRFGCSGGVAKIGEFSVQNVTESSVIVRVPTDCHRSISRLKPLFGELHAPTSDNTLLGENCKGLLQDGCSLMEKFLGTQNRLRTCGSNGNISCYSPDTNHSRFFSFRNLTKNSCGSVLSLIAFGHVGGHSPIVLEFGQIQLGWWLKGQCRNTTCSEGAKCIDVGLADGSQGHRCSCPEGYFGDGFANGSPCRRVISSGRPKCLGYGLVNGHCKVTKFGFLIGGAVAGSSLVAVLVLLLFCFRRRCIASRNLSSAKRLLSQAAGNPSIPFFSFKEIEKATNGFSEEQRLGTGAYGTVYAGKLQNDEWVAIKRLKYRDSESIGQVVNEIRLISSVSHPYLVRLLGCCIEQGGPVLVYEFMPNGTLSQHLQRVRGNGLPWTVRLTIATQTARAIAHLHSAMNPPIYHRDVKSSNILLDNDFNAKVADFGLSRLGLTETSHISTAPQETPGYLDPQYYQCFHLSDKSDVYSFGVVLAEIITALKVVDFNRTHSEINLAALAIDKIGSGCIDEIVDPFLEANLDSLSLSSLHRVAELAFRCLSFHRDTRPTMMEVADELEQIWISTRFPHTGEDSLPVSELSSNFGSQRSERKSLKGSRKVAVPQKPPDCVVAIDEIRGNSPVSVQDSWPSDHSSPSSHALLGNMPR